MHPHAAEECSTCRHAQCIRVDDVFMVMQMRACRINSLFHAVSGPGQCDQILTVSSGGQPRIQAILIQSKIINSTCSRAVPHQSPCKGVLAHLSSHCSSDPGIREVITPHSSVLQPPASLMRRAKSLASRRKNQMPRNHHCQQIRKPANDKSSGFLHPVHTSGS